MTFQHMVGLVGGSGQLGSALATGWLESGCLAAENLWVSNRSGNRAGFESWPDVIVTKDNQALADACDIIVLSVPPAWLENVGLAAPDKLIVSVMAGVTLQQLQRHTGSKRVVRAMSSPAARYRLAYSPWCAAASVTGSDRTRVQMLLSACGLEDAVEGEEQIEVFTALTGPVPGFAAFFADCLVQYALANGVAAKTADRAIKQLFLASGKILSEEAATPADHVTEMIEYAGTTAAGLVRMQELGLTQEIAEGLDASRRRVQTIVDQD